MTKLKCALQIGAGLCLAACSSAESVPDVDLPTGNPSTGGVNTAFSGGGWRAHTAQAGWILALLDRSELNLTEAMAEVSSMSSNSGGTWFLTQLAYSKSFSNALQQKDAAKAYSTTGYLGQLEKTLEGRFGGCPSEFESICEDLKLVEAIIGISGGITNLNWYTAVDQTVFGPFNMAKELSGHPINGARQTWADGKTLLFASSILTQKAVLTSYGALDSKQAYGATATGANVPSQDIVSPVVFSSGGGDVKLPEFFMAGELNLKYLSNSWTSPGPGPNVPIGPEMASQAGTAVIATAAASSAAAAGTASVNGIAELTGLPDALSWEFAYKLSDLAPAFNFGTNPLSFVQRPESQYDEGWSDLQKLPLVRLADGGYADNTGVAYTLRYLADNRLADDFTLVSFENTSDDSTYGAHISYDTAQLFGEDPTKECLGSRCIVTVSRQVFEPLPQGGVKFDWQDVQGDITVSYTQIPVTTKENLSFGVPGGRQGTLHQFTAYSPNVGVIPTKEAEIGGYKTLLNVVYEAASTCKGYAYLCNAFQLHGCQVPSSCPGD